MELALLYIEELASTKGLNNQYRDHEGFKWYAHYAVFNIIVLTKLWLNNIVVFVILYRLGLSL